MKILFVCHGNICRSPMAEYIFKSIANNKYIVESRATSFEEIGADLYYLAKDVLDKNNIPYTKHCAKRISNQDYNNFDLIVCFDQNNYNNLEKMFNDTSKIIKLLDYDIDDPWYTRDFDRCFKEVYEGCYRLLNKLNSGD